MLDLVCKLSVIALIQMAIMYKYNSQNLDANFLGKFSIASFSYARPICKIYPASIEDIHVSCDEGNVI